MARLRALKTEQNESVITDSVEKKRAIMNSKTEELMQQLEQPYEGA